MSTQQLPLPFEDVPVTCLVQHRYHVIAPLLAGANSVIERAHACNLGYSTVARWLHEFRERGMPACAGRQEDVPIWIISREHLSVWQLTEPASDGATAQILHTE